MGNYRFRLSDMMPNAWFYKLKDMGKTSNPNFAHPFHQKHHSNTTILPPSPIQHLPHLSLSKHSSYFSNKDILHNSPTNPKGSDTCFPDPPTQSRTRRRRRRRKTNTKTTISSVSSACTCRTTFDSVGKHDSLPSHEPVLFDRAPADPTSPFDSISSWSSSRSCRFSSSTTDIIIDVDNKSSFSTQKIEKFNRFIGSRSPLSNQKYKEFNSFINSNSSLCRQKIEKFNRVDSILELELPPILTRPSKYDDRILDVERKESESEKAIRSCTRLEERNAHRSISLKEESSPVRRLSSSLAPQGLKIRVNSPRLASKKIQACCRKSSSMPTSLMITTKTRKKRATESFAVVKSSFDPQRDFRDSMVEMIVENKIRASKDLEELLACYLSLNSNEYHDMIVKVFEQIWFDLTDI